MSTRQRLTEFHHRRLEQDDEDPDDWRLNDPDLAWRTWTLMQATGNRFLPCAGGLLDQPESLMDDLLTLSWLSGIIEKQIKPQNE